MNDLSRTALAPASTNPIMLRTMEELVKFSKMLSASDLVPKDFVGKEANVFVAIQWGMEIGLQPMQALQSIAVINGRPSLWGDAVIGLVRSSGLCEYIYEEIGADGISATCRTKRKGDEKEVSRTFTMADAEKAGLKGKQGPWTNYPKRMLQMRARSWCLRDVYPDVLRGVHVAEEVQDLPEKDVTPQASTMVEQPRARSEKPQPIDAEEVKGGNGAGEQAAAAAQPTQAADAPPATNGNGNGNGHGDAAKALGEGQLRIIRAKLKNAALTESDLVAKFGKVEDLRFGQFDEIQGWITEKSKQVVGG